MPIEDNGVIRVVAAVADRQKVILYKEDGDTVTVSQGDVRLQALMDEIIPITSRGEVAVVSLAKFSVYADFEEKSKGVVRFYRAKRRALGSLAGDTNPSAEVIVVNMEFTPDIDSDQLAGLMDQVNDYVGPFLTAVDMEVTSNDVRTQETIVERLEPVTREANEESLQDDELIVAVIGDTIIPGVDKLKPYIQHALKTNSTMAVENFLKRAASIIRERSHSVADLMRFLEKGDLPLADDGSIVAYKILKKSIKPGHFVDCHSGNVYQRPGSYVCVEDKLVDLRRDHECSNGLHVARRGYLGNFSGDVCVLIKVAPEDVMVVPHGDPNKVRTKGYHILSQLSDESFRVLSSNQPMTIEQKAQLRLLQALRGEHSSPKEEVRVRAQYGGDLLITDLSTGDAIRNKRARKITDEDRDRARAFDDPNVKSDRLEPREINKRVNAEHAKASNGNGQPSRVEQMDKLFAAYRDAKTPEDHQKAAQAAVLFKRQIKVAWDKLGIEKTVADQLIKIAGGESTPVKTEPVVVHPPEETKAERDARRKREKRAAEKAKREADSFKMPSVKKSENGPKTLQTKVDQISTKVAEYKHDAKIVLSMEQERVLGLIRQGVSQSEVSKQTGVSRRTIGRWVDKYGT